MTTLGKGITHIWPYGKKARLLMVWISTQVVRQKKHKTSRVIMLPFTLRQLMEDLGIQRKPRKTDYENFKRQISALSYSDIYAWCRAHIRSQPFTRLPDPAHHLKIAPEPDGLELCRNTKLRH